MNFLPLDRMWERVASAREASDTDLFLASLYCGEMLLKLTIAGMITALEDDPDRHRYRLRWQLVRADGIGDWDQALNDVLYGPASQYLVSEAQAEKTELTLRCKPGDWQYESVALLHESLNLVEPGLEPLPAKPNLRKWFTLFTQLRNKTRGHGALTPTICGRVGQRLERSIDLVRDNLSLFRRPWAYLHQSLSGKYRVTRLTNDSTPFDPMRTMPQANLPDGIYIYYDWPRQVQLVESDPDATDFFIANGAFTPRAYELLSYITNAKKEGDSQLFLAPVGVLPPSETEGSQDLDIQGGSFSNLPPRPDDYIGRPELERELHDLVCDDRHPVVTLLGRGGIGKTSLALSVLHRITGEARFEAILWFSARDIDLLPQGPRLVRPRVRTERDIAAEFARLIGAQRPEDKSFDSLAYLSSALQRSPLGGPILFVFDNFETVRNPLDIFAWLDMHVRLPNKILITTRFRDFRGDYPVEVGGMTRNEFDELVDRTSKRLSVFKLLTSSYRDELYRESDGHPYVVKILLGEVASAGKAVKVERILAGKGDILDALFERTYAGLSSVAQRVLLTLCRWRSVVPQLAMEAVLLRPGNDRVNADRSIDELTRSSLVEVRTSDADNETFLVVPFVTRAFGERKLAASPLRTAIEMDTQLLQAFGATRPTDIRHGLAPRIEALFRWIDNSVCDDRDELSKHMPMLEFVARRHPAAWLRMANLYEQVGEIEEATNALRLHLESAPDQPWVWEKLADFCRKGGDYQGAINALVAMCQVEGTTFWQVSQAANKLNDIFKSQFDLLESDEKRFVVQQVVDIMERRQDEANATDFSRLAWMCLHLRDTDKAKLYTTRGLSLDPDNEHCQKLAKRFNVQA